MSARISIMIHLRLLTLFAISLSGSSAAPPEWWSQTSNGLGPVLTTAPPSNSAAANLGQAKHVAIKAVGLLQTIDPVIGSLLILEDFTVGDVEPIFYFGVPNPKTEEWIQAQHRALTIGELKSIAKPIYDRLYSINPLWLDNESTNPAEKGQLQLNGTKDPNDGNNYYPWTTTVSDDNDNAVATIGQLKSVFALDFSKLDTDYDDDGLTNEYEANYSHTDPRNPDTDGDGLSDSYEVNTATDPLIHEPSVAMTALAQDWKNRVDGLLDGKVASDSTRNIFSTKDHVTPVYVRNPALWCSGLHPQLACVAAYKPYSSAFGTESHGGTLLTPRHILYVRHGITPGWNGTGNPPSVRFVKPNGDPINRSIIASSYSDAQDLFIGLLDQPVPPEIGFAKVLGPLTVMQERQLGRLKINGICVSQSRFSIIEGQTHESRAYPVSIFNGSLPAGYSPWIHSTYSGDSGTPQFVVTADGLALATLVSMLSGRGAFDVAVLDDLIDQCDASAGVDTGLQVTLTGVTIPPN
jgi:hypothetical protein